MSDPEHIDPAATAASLTSRAPPHITVDGKAVMHVAVAMSALSPNSFPIAVAFAKSGWSDVVCLPFQLETGWFDREWDAEHVALMGLARSYLQRDGLPARAGARFIATAVRNHVLVARLAGYQHHWLCNLLDLCDDRVTLDWIEFRDYLDIIAHEVALSDPRFRELVGRHAAFNPRDARISSDVAAQIDLTNLVVSESGSTIAQSNPPTTLALKRPGSAAS
jgi:hypothetical protein